jgi:dolichyl-phosphate-mannose-protein mannosyltransferase
MMAKRKRNTLNRFINNILPVLPTVVFVFILRLALSYLPSFDIDMGAWLAWARRMVDFGPSGFYSETIWTQYPPGFLYWLWFGAKVGWLNELLVKIPIALADILTGLLIWKIIAKRNARFATALFIAYALNPAVVFVGSVWGQIDGILALFLFLSIYLLLEKKNPVLSWVSWAVALLLKPQSLVLLPVLLILSILKFTPKKTLIAALFAAGLIFLGSLPFFPQDPIFGLPRLMLKMSQHYAFTSLFAFNLWSIIGGMWKPDATEVFGVSYMHWGILLFLLGAFLTTYSFFVAKRSKANSYLFAGLLFLAFFLFPTRVHERYLFPLFHFLLAAAGLAENRILLGLCGISSLVFLINLYHPYAYYTDNFLRSEALLNLSGSLAPFIALFYLVLFVVLITFMKNKEVEQPSVVKRRFL